jgi:hypothetical protein
LVVYHRGSGTNVPLSICHVARKFDFTQYLAQVTNYDMFYSDAGGDETVIAVNHLRGVSLAATGAGGLKEKEKKYFFVNQLEQTYQTL